MVLVAAVDNSIGHILLNLDRGDILIAGGNSYYIDDIRGAKAAAGSAAAESFLRRYARYAFTLSPTPWHTLGFRLMALDI